MTIKVETKIHKVLIDNKTTSIMNNCLTARIVLAGWPVTINQHNWIDRYIHTLIHTLIQIAWTDTFKLAARFDNSANYAFAFPFFEKIYCQFVGLPTLAPLETT